MNEPACQTVHRIGTPDGRTIRAFDGGAPDGAPFVFHHGTPLCGRLQAHVVDDAAAHGLRVITYDRPGYGESSRLPGLRVGSSAVDTQTVADHFQLGRFATAGVSGGGPHALAAAALLRPRGRGGGGRRRWPFDAEGLDWFDGMGDLNTEERESCSRARRRTTPTCRSRPRSSREHSGRAAGGHGQPALAGRQRLTGDVIEHMHATMTEALAAGIEGGPTSRRPSTSRGGSTWRRSTCPCGSGTASTTGSSRWPTGGGSPSTSPARSSTCGRTTATSA